MVYEAHECCWKISTIKNGVMGVEERMRRGVHQGRCSSVNRVG